MAGIIIGAALGSLVLGGGLGYLIFYFVQKNRTGAAHEQAKKLVENAKAEAQAYKKEAMLEAKEEALKLKNETDNDIRERRAEIQRMENRIVQREEALDRKEDVLDKKIQAADDAKAQIEAWSCVSRITTNSGKITVYCYDLSPTTEIQIQIICIR